MEILNHFITMSDESIALAGLFTLFVKIVKVLEVLFILFACKILITLSQKLSKKILDPWIKRTKMPMTKRKINTLSTVSNNIIKYLIYFIGIVSILNLLGVPTESMIVVASAFSVALGFGARGIVTDLLEGFFILFEDHYAVGDVVTIQGITGTVESITLRSTKLRDIMGSMHIINNGSIRIVTNNCVEFINAAVTVGISYGENIDHAIDILKDEMSKTTDIENIIETPVVTGVIGLDNSTVTLKVMAKCKIKTAASVEAELRRRIKNRFDAESIETPFVQKQRSS